MFWRLWRRTDILDRGEAARRLHSAWLTQALESGHEYPRIPIRRVDEGGFSVLRSTSYGRQVSEAWWTIALEHMDQPGNRGLNHAGDSTPGHRRTEK